MARFHSCNVLHVGPDQRRVWQFDARNAAFALNREEAAANGQPLPVALVTKNWRSLWQRKLNVAWLPSESVFLRVAHLPKSSFEETRAMVELQLEKLSPIPVTQVVWSLHVMPQGLDNLQTVVVVLAERKVVEEFLGKLEGQGYLADSLELPVLDQLRATKPDEDAAWIYPAAGGQKNSALVAWWCGGALRNINLIALPDTGDRVASLKAQLGQITWAGELEGWLTGNPSWHLVANDASAAEWETALRQAIDTPVQLSAPLRPVELAALTARRATDVAAQANLLPKEYEKRYQQQFVDRLWLRGLGAVVGLYVAGVIIYGLALLVLSLQTQSVEKKVAGLSNDYTNAMQLEARSEVLKDRQALKFAALDCWRAVADAMPNELTLDGLGFSDGRKLTLNGNAPAGQDRAILDFNDQLRKTKVGDQLLFDPKKAEPPRYSAGPGGGLTWNFSLELLRVETP